MSYTINNLCTFKLLYNYYFVKKYDNIIFIFLSKNN